MKKIFATVLVLMSVAVTASATVVTNPNEAAPLESRTTSSSTPILATAHYNLSDPEFSFSYDFSKPITNFNLPFASHFYISGKHLEFTISQEEFEWRLVRNNPNNYYDFIIGFEENGFSSSGILRIYFQ